LVIEAWLLAFVGLALPLGLLSQLECHARRRFYGQRRPEHTAAGAAAVPDGAHSPLPPQQDRQRRRRPTSLGAWLTDLYLASCVAWCGACAVLAFPHSSQATEAG
jgi:hypothetical protein